MSATKEETTVTIDARGVYYRQLNAQIKKAIAAGAARVRLEHVLGHRYIGSGIRTKAIIEITGTPGQDLAMFMDGPQIIVHGNGQDGIGNTMTSGEIVIHGHGGDLAGHSLRGGSIYIKGGVGYRCAIHMKQFVEPVPAMVVGGIVGDYAGEYMAGGVLIVLGLGRKDGQQLVGRYLGTGMHAGAIYLRGDARDDQMGKEIGRVPMEDADRERLETHVGRFAMHFGMDAKKLLAGNFTKFSATSARPYGRLYVY